jgi:hypothetical protein
MARADFNYRKTWQQQSSRKIEQVCELVSGHDIHVQLHSLFEQAAERQPFLCRFANDWATKTSWLFTLSNAAPTCVVLVPMRMSRSLL